MAYVIKTTTTELADKHYMSTDHLYEMTASQAIKAERINEPGIEYNIIPASLAHKYVRQGMTHSTPLYVDDLGRIRR
jgi:hypothetical protein